MKNCSIEVGPYTVRVSAEDYAIALAYSWSPVITKSRRTEKIYAARNAGDGSKCYLHREIMRQLLVTDRLSPKLMNDKQVGFKNSDTLDCTRENLILLPKKTRLRRSVEQIKRAA